MMEFILGVIASLVAAMLFPALGDFGSATFARLFGWLPFKGKTNLSGKWSSTWHVQSERFSSEVTDGESLIRQLGNRIYIRFEANGIEFQAKGTIDSGRYVTGVWYDQTEGGYHGAFQLVIDPQTRNMSGLWIGYSTSGVVKHGQWVWLQ